MTETPAVGAVLWHGSRTAAGERNVCRVLDAQPDPELPSCGFSAVFVNPKRPAEKRLPTDRPFWVWAGSPEHDRMSPFFGLSRYEPHGQLAIDPLLFLHPLV